MKKTSKIYIAGNTGMVGSAILRNLKSKGYSNFVFTPFPEYDLTNQKTVADFFSKERPEFVIDAAAKVGGIHANNTFRAQFIYENLMIQNNLIHQSHIHGVKKLLFLGSSCIYPRNCPQPIKEEYLLSGLLEPTNEPYAIAKIAGIKMCENYFRQYGSNFISVMPTNLYGPGDNYDLNSSHVIPALIRKFHEAKIKNSQNVELWGTGAPKREFLYVEDMADACVFTIQNLEANELYANGIEHINIGSGADLTINKLAQSIKDIIGYSGKIVFDKTKPDGTPRKLLDVSRITGLGWESRIDLITGLKNSYKYYLQNLTE
ncbi:MAG: GDP-L-fucose synthase [Bacteroidetes bacterium]|jgi:GDP-L-fucose synthase|nr:GDP-L-fucose synthase [Bacteroidota bacterium]